MKQYLNYLFLLLMYQDTGNQWIDNFVFYTSFYLEFAAAIGVLLLVLLNEPIRSRRRPEDKLIFWECVLVFSQNVLDISLVPLVAVEDRWAYYAFYIALTVNEVLYLSIILQWLICVDYSLHRSIDHIKRQYRHAAVPILVVAALDIIHDFAHAGVLPIPVPSVYAGYILHSIKVVIELGYILTAIFLVVRYEREAKEPRFLRIGAFIIPFLFGALFRFYDASFLGLGVILTHAAMKRRDRFIDFDRGMYKGEYLDYLGTFWDKKGITDGTAILLSAPEHDRELGEMVKEVNIRNCFNIALGDGRYVLLTGELRKSAIRMTEQLIRDAAGESAPPFEVAVSSMVRGKEQTMGAFVAQVRGSLTEGGAS